MKLRNSVNGNVPFEGDRTFRWQAIPANAKVLSATATVTPVDVAGDGSFAEVLGFRPATNFGTTKSVGEVTLAGAPVTQLRWVEVDFHARRTIAGVTGSFNGATLQVDVGGGTYVEINRTGAFKTPSDPTDFSFTGSSVSVSLPALTVAKLKLTQANFTPDLTNVSIRSVPSNVSLRVGDLAPFWTHVGEMTSVETTPDFGAVLAAALTTTKAVNGFYDLPITLHSDTIARFKVELEIEILIQQDVSTKAVPEIALPFDVSTLSKAKTAEFSIEVPANSKVVPAQTGARVRGAFDDTRIAVGPVGEDRPSAAIEISPTYSQAQIIALRNEVAAVAIDLLLESLTPSSRLQLDIRGDFDGKPDEIPLLPTPVEFRIEQRAEKGASWTSVPLPSEFLFAKASEKGSRYWLLLQSLEGRAVWSVEEVAKAKNGASADYLPVEDKDTRGIANVQRTLNGGLSWTDALPQSGTLLDSKATPPFVALLRLRNKPKTFKMPIRLQVGTGPKAVTKTLERFEGLGRVDFTIDTEFADGINEYLGKTSAAVVPETQHLVNADFERWERLGEQMSSRPTIRFDVPIEGVAFAPDGGLAYVLDQVEKEGFILLVDVACNNKIDGKRIALNLRNPLALAIHPDGTRAYVTDGHNLRAVSLESHEALGLPLQVIDPSEPPSNTVTLSPDGRRLYLVNVVTLNQTTRKNVIRSVEIADLEQATTRDKIIPRFELENPSRSEEPSASPVAIAISPDEKWMYLLVAIGTTGNFLVKFIDLSGFTASGASVSVGPEATALALTTDGKKLVVTNKNANNISIIDTTTRTAELVPVSTSPPPSVAPQPTAVVLSPDGKYAYVFNQGSRSIDTIDIKGRKVLTTFTLRDGIPNDQNIARMALSLQGDQIYIVNLGSDTLSSVQFGGRVPAEWQRTSGDVRPQCYPEFHRVAVIGGAESLPSSISQVVPVTQLVPYEFSFWGIAIETDFVESTAIAEVLWRNNACGLLRRDLIPIEIMHVLGDMHPVSFLIGGGNAEKAPLVFHRLTTRKVDGKIEPLTAPEGADQAEVRFSVGPRGGAAIDLVSLSATPEVAANGDFKLKKGEQLVDWALVPEVTPGFSVVGVENGLQLRNAGATLAELVQKVAAESERSFTVEFQGKASAGPAGAELPRIELRWLKANGSTAGDPTVMEIQPDGLDSATAAGIVPKDSTNVEIHIVAPAKTTLEVNRISLQYPRTTTVPVKFISEAPGDMFVSEIHLSFERTPPQAPPIPPQGLCTATPPAREPGEKGNCCYCHKCEEETVMTGMTAITTEGGRPATKGRCSSCGTKVVNAGGPVIDAAESFAPQPMASQPVVVRSLAARVGPPQVVAETIELTDIRGIGAARAQQLRDIGIDSVEKLADAAPESVSKIKFITQRMATEIIVQARSRVRRLP